MRTVAYKTVKQGERRFSLTLSEVDGGIFQVRKRDLEELQLVYKKEGGLEAMENLFNREMDYP